MAYEIDLPIKTLDIEAGGRHVALQADLSAGAMAEFGQAAKRAQERMKGGKKLAKEAAKRGDLSKAMELMAQAERAMADTAAVVVGEEGVARFKEAMCPGASGARCLEATEALLGVIAKAVEAERDPAIEEKAAHYLSEVESAQPYPDPAA